MDDYRSPSHTKWDCKYHVVLHPEVPAFRKWWATSRGRVAIHIACVCGERKRNLVGQHLWARGYFVSTLGRDEEVIRE